MFFFYYYYYYSFSVSHFELETYVVELINVSDLFTIIIRKHLKTYSHIINTWIWGSTLSLPVSYCLIFITVYFSVKPVTLETGMENASVGFSCS